MNSNTEHSAALRIKLTPFQTNEIEHGMSVDADEGRPPWGAFTYIGKTKRGASWLEVTNLPAALYRITNCRDIWQDNASSSWEAAPYRSGARSLERLVEQIVEMAGGRDAVLALPQMPWGSHDEPDATMGGEDLRRYI